MLIEIYRCKPRNDVKLIQYYSMRLLYLAKHLLLRHNIKTDQTQENYSAT